MVDSPPLRMGKIFFATVNRACMQRVSYQGG